MFKRLRFYDWTFSSTAEVVVAALLGLTIVITVISLA
jgi:hypothetical protein